MNSGIGRCLRSSLRLACVSLVLAILSVCSDPNPALDYGPDLTVTELPTTAQVSNPKGLVAIAGSAAARMSNVAGDANGAEQRVYVTLPTDAAPEGVRARIRRVGDEAPITVAVQDGGFDPVAVPASSGDFIEIVVMGMDGSVVFSSVVTVSPSRRPTVVRTWPPRKKSDKPVNKLVSDLPVDLNLVVVFSEPVDGATVTDKSVRLFAGSLEIAGQARVLDGDGTTISFNPKENLEPNREYRLVVSRSIADLDGETMESDVVVGFITGSSTLGPPTSLRVSPDSIVLLVGSTYQFSAKVFDDAGNLLVRPVTWQTSAPDLMSISPTGLVTARATQFVSSANWGVGRVEARVGTLSGSSEYVAVVPQPGSIEIQPPQATLGVGDTLAVRVVVRGGGFNDPIQPPLTVSNSNPTVASVSVPNLGAIQVSQFRTVTALTEGVSRITVRAGSVSATIDITVSDDIAVDTVRVAPAAAELAVGETLQLTAWLRDGHGNFIQGQRPVSWSSNNTSVLAVNGTGRVTAVANGTATITATSEGRTGSTTITVRFQPEAPTFTEIMANQAQTCGVTLALDVFCWGSQASLVPALLPGGLNLVAISPSGSSGYLCGRANAGEAFCWSQFASTPYRFGSPLRFSDLSTALFGHACGVATDGSTYCWGNNRYGQLGDGTTVSRGGIPTTVLGNHAFQSVTVGWEHSCGLSVAGDAYCWGNNTHWIGSQDRLYVRGMLGSADTVTAVIPTPTRVAGGHAFSQLSAGYSHTCGITTDGKAYCWGYNVSGQVGDGTQTDRAEPTAVETSLRFKAISAASTSHTCALTTDGAAYCWGSNSNGEGGASAENCTLYGPCNRKPVAIQGNLSFARIAIGAGFSCGIATTGRAYCWGYNSEGRLGDGTTINRYAPTPVSRP